MLFALASLEREALAVGFVASCVACVWHGILPGIEQDPDEATTTGLVGVLHWSGYLSTGVM